MPDQPPPPTGGLPRLRRRGAAYALALLAAAAATALRLALNDTLPETGFPFITYFPTVMLTALFGGLGPGLLAAALSTLAAKWLFIPPFGQLSVDSPETAIALGFFVVVLLVDVLVVHVMTDALDRVHAKRRRIAALSGELTARVAELDARERDLRAALAAAERDRADLAASEQRFRILADATQDGVVIHDGEHITDANEAFRRMHGIPSRAALPGLPVMDLIAPECRDAVRRRVGSDDATPVEMTALTADGTTRFPVEVAGRAIRHQGRALRVAVVRDLRARRQAEATLRASEARLRLFVDRAPAAIAMFDTEMRYLAVSRRFLRDYRLGGVDGPGALLGRSHYEIFPEISEHWRDLHRRVLATGETLAAEEDPFTRADGAVDWIRWEMAPWRRDDGSIGGALLFSEVISDRIAAERAMAEGEERLRLALEAGQMGIWDWDLRSDRLTWDARQNALFGFDPQAPPPTGEDALARVHPEDRAALDAAIAAAIADPDGRLAHEFRVCLPGGGVRWLLGHGHAVRDPAGRPVRMVGLNLDITERRTATEAIAEREATLTAVLDALPVGVIIAGPDGRILRDNAAHRELWGLPQDGGAGSDIGARTGWWPDSGARIAPADWAIARALARGEVVHGELVACARATTGERRVYLNNAAPVRDAAGRIVAAVAAEQDVTERRAIEQALAASEQRFRAIADATPALLFETDPDGRNVYVNRGYADYAGLPPEALLGTGWLHVLHPEERDEVAATWRAAVAEGGTYTVELRMRRHDGTWRWFLVRGVPMRGDAGALERWVGTCTDIHDQKQAAEMLTREAEQLDRLAEDRGRALAESEARLAHAAKMEALGRLAGGIAHDFNNVLQAMQGGIALAARRLPADPAAARHYLDLAAEAAGRGAAVTGRLLGFARGGALRAEPIAALPLLQGVAELLRPALGPQIDLAVRVPQGLPPLLADRSQLEAVLVNLANNARDAMPQGGRLVLTAEAVLHPHAPDAPTGLAPGIYIRLAVIDAGEGMTPELLARVTEPFFTTKPRGQGTGLGLAMARGFAEQSGGGLAIRSACGRGTTVALWLPRAAQRSAAPPAANDDATPPPSPAGLRILLAEDKPEVRDVLAAGLQDHGFIVIAVEDAAGALRLLRGGAAPDVLVTDLAMPGALDGLDLVREARRHLPRLPALLVTGHVGESDPAKLAEAERGGPFALLRKPVGIAALLQRLDRVLGGGAAASP